MSFKVWCVAIAALICCIANTFASENVFFFVSRAEPVCFMDELLQTATLIITYKHEDFETKPLEAKVLHQGILVRTTKLDEKAGRVAFAAEETGAYRICIQAEEGSNFPAVGQAKVYLQTQVLPNSVHDEAEVGEPVVAKQKQVVSLQEELQRVSESIDMLLKKIQIARERETHFRDQSERINERVVWWSIAQTLVLIIAGAFQSVHLHRFFLQKKIA